MRILKKLIMNDAMDKIINNIDLQSERQLDIKLDSLRALFSPRFIRVHDCIIISDNDIVLSDEKFDKVIHMFTDRTGYEASNTDTRINDYFENLEMPFNEAVVIAVMAINIWSNELKFIEPTAKFCFVIGCSDMYVTIRYHKFRKNEGLWLSENLEEYENPVGYIIL